MKVYITTLIIGFVSIISVTNAQSLPKETIQKIDSLFSTWDTKNSPGCAIGIVRNDSLIFSKGYGMANLEYEIPITPETIFYMCSVSKQFTGYSIALLARQGKLKLDEDIHVYLPWLGGFGKRITVRNLLNHTSGLRDDIGLAAITGLGSDGMLTQDLAINLLKRQHSLNFAPGSRYSYSNSNYVLLAEIVKSVSGKSFRAFTDSSIFKPLGMSDSRFQDEYVELLKNRAYAYQRLDSTHYNSDFQNVYTLGDGGLFTNINDMAKWITNFYTPKAGDANDIHQLTEQGKLTNGKEINYALGISVDKYRGQKIFSHGGALGGYRTFISVFPELKLGFIVFSNLGDFSPGNKAYDLANLFINDPAKKNLPETQDRPDSSKAVLYDTSTIKKITGSYISEDGIQLNFRLTNKKLYADAFGRSFLLLKGTRDTFAFFIDPDVKVSFNTNPGKETTAFMAFSPDDPHLLKKYDLDTTQSDQVLRAYTGTYYSPELDVRYGIALKDHHLILTNNKYNDTRLTLIGRDHLTSGYWWMDHLVILRNNKKEISGFELNSSRIMHLRFNKVE